VLVRGDEPETVRRDALDLRHGFQTLYYCFEAGLPPS
jgi:glycine hydroxymethyltransferase